MEQGKDANRRAYERFALDLKVRVHAAGGDGRQVLEDSVLRDVSGSGAAFPSRDPGRYHIGQRLLLVIQLPGTDRIDARLEGHATIIRIGGPGADDPALIGVTMDDMLDFRRSDIPPEGTGEDA
jgi:hypothetical protein